MGWLLIGMNPNESLRNNLKKNNNQKTLLKIQPFWAHFILITIQISLGLRGLKRVLGNLYIIKNWLQNKIIICLKKCSLFATYLTVKQVFAINTTTYYLHLNNIESNKP